MISTKNAQVNLPVNKPHYTNYPTPDSRIDARHQSRPAFAVTLSRLPTSPPVLRPLRPA